MQLVHPKLDKVTSLARRMELIACVEEIKMQETDLSWLAPQYKEVADFLRVCVMYVAFCTIPS